MFFRSPMMSLNNQFVNTVSCVYSLSYQRNLGKTTPVTNRIKMFQNATYKDTMCKATINA